MTPPWLRPGDALDPRGPYAERIADLWWILFGVAAAVFLIVAALFVVGLLRRGRDATDLGPTDAGEAAHRWIVAGTIVTALVLLATALLTFDTMAALASPAAAPEHTFEVVGHQWWWEIRYEGEPIGANEIHVPVGESVALRLASGDVIHSLWIPELIAKRDLIPGHPTSVWLQADEAGVYRGLCAEFCGVQHAKMGLLVVAEEPARFDAWLERVRAGAAEPDGEAATRGQDVFLATGCSACHTIRGTEAGGQLGPDLTHLASRLSLAAAQLPNTPGHLAGWIVNPQQLKPGNEMPPQDLSGPELQALLAYLSGLE